MKIFKVAITLSLGLITLALPAHAAVTSITKAAPLASGTFSDGAGDQVSALMSTPRQILLAGTAEGGPGDWLTTPSLGGSDGFISAFSYTGRLDWSLRLGTSDDDIATAGLVSSTGPLWVAGVSAPHSELKELTVWQLSPSGAILNTFHTTAPSIIYPHAITESTSGLTISGSDFSITMSKSGTFGAFKALTYKAPKPATKFVGTTYSWTIYTGRGPVAGVPTFKPKKASTLYYKYLNSTKSIRIAYQVSTEPNHIKYQKDYGLVMLSEEENGFSLTTLR